MLKWLDLAVRIPINISDQTEILYCDKSSVPIQGNDALFKKHKTKQKSHYRQLECNPEGNWRRYKVWHHIQRKSIASSMWSLTSSPKFNSNPANWFRSSQGSEPHLQSPTMHQVLRAIAKTFFLLFRKESLWTKQWFKYMELVYLCQSLGSNSNGTLKRNLDMGKIPRLWVWSRSKPLK